MPYIPIVPPEDATGPLADIYAAIRDARGRVANFYQLQSLDPDTLRAHRDLYWSTMHRGGGLPVLEREAMALAVSVANGCDYCARHHVAHLRAEGGSESLILSLTLSESPATASRRLQQLIYYARKLTLLPNSVGAEDIRELRRHGLTDEELLQAAQIIAYYNYVNRLANSLGAELERD